jgi:hypothetical protein
MREKAARQKVKTKRARLGDRRRDMAGRPRRSLRDIFVDFLSEEKEGCQATRVFDNVLALGQRWTRLVEYFGRGILLLIPQDLTNEEWVSHLYVLLLSQYANHFTASECLSWMKWIPL